MRSLSEIVQANINAEAKEARNDAEDKRNAKRALIRGSQIHEEMNRAQARVDKGIAFHAINRCKACGEEVEDCICRLRGGNVQL